MMTKSQRGPLHLREINRARDYYNPLRGLDMPRLVRLLEEGERGMYANLAKLYRMMEKRDSTLRALKYRRLSALGKLDWDIKTPDELPTGITQGQADAQAAFLRARYELIENLPEVFQFLALATFRGFAHLEKHYQDGKPSLPVIRLQPVPQYHWTRDQHDWTWKYDPEALGNWSTGTPIEAGHFIIRELDDPLNEIAVLCGLRKNMAQKDWDAFMEDYAIPSIFGILGQNTPSTEVAAWLEQMEKVTSNSRGALPPGSDIKTVAQGQQGETPFKQYKDEQREELVLAGTGGLLSMLTAPTGLNSEQAAVHDAAFEALAIAEAMSESAILQTQFDKPLLAEEFPGQPAAAYFELAAVDQEDRTALSTLLLTLAQAGLEADENEISEKMGLKLRKKVAAPSPFGGGPADPAALPNRRASWLNRADATDVGRDAIFKANAAAQELAARRPVFRPVAEQLASLLAIADLAERRAAAERMRAGAAELSRQVLAKAPDLAEPVAAAIGAAVASGMAENAAQKERKP